MIQPRSKFRGGDTTQLFAAVSGPIQRSKLTLFWPTGVQRFGQSVQNTEMSAKTPYSRAQGYATRSCWPSIAKAEMKILEAEKLHQPMIPAVRRIPIIPLQDRNKECQTCVFLPIGLVTGLLTLLTDSKINFSYLWLFKWNNSREDSRMILFHFDSIKNPKPTSCIWNTKAVSKLTLVISPWFHIAMTNHTDFLLFVEFKSVS